MLQMHFAVLCLVVTVLTASGCGSSSKTTTVAVATTPLTRAELIAKGDSICTRVNAEVTATATKSTQSYADILPRAAAYYRSEAAELGKLTPPASLAGDWKQIVTETQTFAEETAKAGQYAKSNNTQAMNSLFAAGRTTHHQLGAIALRDGFKVCSLS